MKLSTKLTYKQAMDIKNAGFEVEDLDENIKAFEELKSALISHMNTIFTHWTCLNSSEELSLDNLKKLDTDFVRLLNTPNINNYFFEEQGTTELSILFEDLIGSSSRIKFLIENYENELYTKYKNIYLKFFSDTAYRFKITLIADFNLVENTN